MLKKIRIIDYARCEKAIKKSLLVSLGFSLFLFVISFLLYMSFSYMGGRNKQIEDLIFSEYKLLLTWINLKIFLAYIAIAIITSIFCLLLKIGKKRYILLFNMFYWFMFWVRGIKLYPQMFSEQLFNKGGLFKYFQLVITDYTPFALIYGIFAAVILGIGIKNKRLGGSFAILAVSFLMISSLGVPPVNGSEVSPSQPNVLIFATDSLRPDLISYNGYHRETPAMDKLFSKGVNFLNHKSSMARTLPSWTSIFTSTFPPDHKMRHMFPDKSGLKKNWETIVDVFNRENYYTSVVSDFAGDIFPSIDYGFQEVVSPELSFQMVLKQRCQEIHDFLVGFLVNPMGRTFFPEMWGVTLNKDPWYVTRYTKKAIKKSFRQNKPFFILSFSSNNHFPYVTKYPYYKLYTPGNYTGRHKYGLSGEVLGTYLEADLDKEEVAHIRDHYDNATKLFDDNLAEMLTFLKESKIDKNTVVIIMSDHGESLCEENWGLGHGDHLLGPYTNNMTFGVYSPLEDFKGRRIEKTTRDIDIAPTILDLLNMEIPGSFKGHSLLPVMRGADFPGYPVYLETGIWYSPTTPFIPDKLRLPYPVIVDMLNVSRQTGKIFLKKEYEDAVIKAKHKGYQLNEKKYIYMADENNFQENFYIDEKPVPREQITDPGFLDFKQKMVEMFKGKFYIDPKGFIREYAVDKSISTE
ncbi:MAG: sulfatase-like hydrolase/transferase [bacterium]|nr:sulfatase-like hydrolase/transferase [bacterium]